MESCITVLWCLVIEYPSLRPVAFLLHQGSPCDAKIYEEILEELKRIFDKGYYGYKNRTMLWEFPDSKSLKNLHRYTKRSVEKFVCLHVLLVGIVFSWVLTQRRNYRRLLNGSLWRGL